MLSDSFQYLYRKALTAAERVMPDNYAKLRRVKSAVLRNRAVPERKIYSPAFPDEYHFLLTDYCNAECRFCNQSFDGAYKKEMTLDRFEAIVSNIPVASARSFVLTGGGEPLVCRDLLKIIERVNTSYPWIDLVIRTNGLLLEKLAKDLAELDVGKLEISIHGTGAENDYLTRRVGSADRVFRGIALLNEYLSRRKGEIAIQFCPVVSRLNVALIPDLIRKASELHVGEVEIEFCRYFPHREGKGIDARDSLYFHKRLYNSVIRKARALGHELGVEVRHGTMFGHNYPGISCFLPWTVLLVDAEGDVFPCCGGEVWFGPKVKSGEYDFGNLLEGHVSDFWDNETYVKLRTTHASGCTNVLVPECIDCHMTVNVGSSDNKRGHIIRGGPFQ